MYMNFTKNRFGLKATRKIQQKKEERKVIDVQ